MEPTANGSKVIYSQNAEKHSHLITKGSQSTWLWILSNIKWYLLINTIIPLLKEFGAHDCEFWVIAMKFTARVSKVVYSQDIGKTHPSHC